MTDAYLFICADCVTEQFLSEQIVASGSARQCMSCGQEGQKCWALEALAARVRAVFDAQYCLREGVAPTAVVENLTGLSDSICEEILDRWSDIACLDDGDLADEDAYGADAYGPDAYGPGAYGPDAYGPGACQAEDGIDADAIALQWQKIREALLPLAPALPDRLAA